MLLNKRFKTGFVVGKFCPLHRGHIFMIKEAMKQCEHLIILSYTSQEFPKCSAANRKHWLKETFNSKVQEELECEVKIVVYNEADTFPPDDAEAYEHRLFCAHFLLEIMETTVQAVFTSESYGYGLAEQMSAYFTRSLDTLCKVEHVMVDERRTIVPTSGTMVRGMDVNKAIADGFLTPLVAADLFPKVLILGGESSGKTTLSKALSQKLRTTWVPEYGRVLFERRKGKLFYEDLEHIAIEQLKFERLVGQRANEVIICDTSPLTTMFYSQQMFGRVSTFLRTMAERSIANYDAVYVCDSNIAFHQDGTRRDEAFRSLAFDYYMEAYNGPSSDPEWYKRKYHKDSPTMVVFGSVEERCAQVISDLKNKGLLTGR